MTVKGLFDHFEEYFDAIVYYDMTWNKQDSITIIHGDVVEYDSYNDFLREYGDYKVIDWKYLYHGIIDMRIEDEHVI